MATEPSPRPTRPRRPARSLADVPYRELAEALRTQSLAAIARHYGCARNTVRWWRRKLDLPGPDAPAPPCPPPTPAPPLRHSLSQHGAGSPLPC